RVSHGCIRMPNKSILKLARLMPVGTPLTVR
ncbi:MAG: L,D-transpeptidase, partial [Gaiellales bacterium]